MQDLIQKISSLAEKSASSPFIAAIDGRCGAGKSTLAEMLKQKGWTVFQMDDFFLQAHQRTPERLNTPGGNADRERFAREVLIPLKSGEDVITYRPFDCKTMSLSEQVTVKRGKFCAVEGSYCCHPELWEYYDTHIFLTVDSDEQMKRIIARCGSERAEAFKNRWIPLEEKYFSAFRVEDRAEIVFKSQN
ncbi:MAG: uridine kinase [Oscillospiraceae bacterium]|nr:uridine kinase [Oscillospiraceae bacterium]